ncbi:MAG TPA: hypothetical protein VHH36_01710 [Candidatus Thermoplasmatota archaeon]|nr:hypothetical protein [Candidatus Thermoplasmatota archaeon]
MLFLQYCRLRDPDFARGLMGNPADAGRVAELEKRVVELDRDRDEAERRAGEAEKRVDELERRLAEAHERQQSLTSYVVDLARAQDNNRERAVAASVPFEAVPKPLLGIINAFAAKPRMTRKELEARLVEAGMTQQEAGDAITSAARMDLIVKGRDMAYRLAQPPREEEE